MQPVQNINEQVAIWESFSQATTHNANNNKNYNVATRSSIQFKILLCVTSLILGRPVDRRESRRKFCIWTFVHILSV